MAACRMYSGTRELVDGYTKWMCEWVDTRRKVAEISGGVTLMQVVPAVAFPIGVGPSSGERSIVLYLSFEHPFKKSGA